ncbi:DUF6879 family protein [Kitasatospora sp. NPDC088351]|uniref:DUF6879 family protein n=1 Tax=unclassified Kitasatospora TaxID=2633591 RepID=UPI003433FBCF
MTQSAPNFDELLKAARVSAVHLEMRDAYGVEDEAEDFANWLSSGQRDVDPEGEYWKPWAEAISEKVSQGVTVRRARIISEPVTDYIKYEHAGTVVNLSAGEQVRWLPRRLASDIALPGNDLWIFDGDKVLFNHFTGTGDWAMPGLELRTEPAVVKLCVAAFETVWERGVPHEKYKV